MINMTFKEKSSFLRNLKESNTKVLDENQKMLIEKLSHDRIDLVRSDVAATLVYFTCDFSRDILIRLVRDKDEYVSLGAIEALVNFYYPEVYKFLKETSNEKYLFLQNLQESDLEVLDENQKMLIEKLSHDRIGLVRSDVAAVLVYFTCDFSKDILMRLAGDKDELVRTEVADVLGSFYYPEVYELLKEAINDPYYLVRGYAIISMEEVGRNIGIDYKEMKTIINQLMQKEEYSFVILDCYQALYELDDEDQLNNIIAVFESEDFIDRQRIVSEYAIDRQCVISILDQILSDKNYVKIKKFLDEAIDNEKKSSVVSVMERLLNRIWKEYSDITNTVVIHADSHEVSRILEAVKTEEFGVGSLDFNKVIPMPPELDLACTDRSTKAYDLYKEFLEESKKLSLSNLPEEKYNKGMSALRDKYDKLVIGDEELLRFGERLYNNIQKYGAKTWYEWRMENWDTTMESYGYDDDYIPGSNKITFKTSCSAPHKIIQKLSEMYPEAVFVHSWAEDEIFGDDKGERTYKNGGVIDGNTDHEK